MIEVLSAARPGRPLLLLVLTAGLFVGALGTAYLQSFWVKTLGPTVAIRGTPLTVRPPRGWVQLENNPGDFVQKSAGHSLHGGEWEFVRSIHCEYQPASGATSAADALRRNGASDVHIASAEPCDLAGLPALQIRHVRTERVSRRQVMQFETLFRAAVTARGDVIYFTYEPYTELTVGDRLRFDDVCRAARLEDAEARVSPAALFQALRVKGAAPADVSAGISPLAPIAGGALARGDARSGWRIELQRTLLGPGREPDALLADAGASQWNCDPRAVPTTELTGAGETQLRRAERPASATAMTGLAELYLAWRTADAVVLISVHADAPRTDEAREAARALVGKLEVGPPPTAIELVQAAQTTQRFAAELSEHGSGPLLLRQPREERFVGKFFGADVLEKRQLSLEQQRGALIGFAGAAEVIVDGRRYTSHVWRVAADGRGYEYNVERHLPPPATQMLERRRADQEAIFRRVSGATVRENTLPIGPLFVPPPLTDAVARWTALQGGDAALIETSAVDAVAMTYVMYFPKGAADGLQWVAELLDYRPDGAWLGFDAETGWLMRQRYANVELERVANPE